MTASAAQHGNGIKSYSYFLAGFKNHIEVLIFSQLA